MIKWLGGIILGMVVFIAALLWRGVTIAPAQSYNPALEQQASYFMWQTLENEKQRAWESQSRTHVYDNQLRRNPYESHQTSDGPMYPGSMSDYRQSVHGSHDD